MSETKGPELTATEAAVIAVVLMLITYGAIRVADQFEPDAVGYASIVHEKGKAWLGF